MTARCKNIEKLRLDFESNLEWGIRRRVLRAFRNKIPLARLVCLSHCFINVEVYGNVYKPPVMKQLKKMRDSISSCQELEELTSRKKSSAVTVKFVKEQNSGSSSDNKQSKIDADLKSGLKKPEKRNQSQVKGKTNNANSGINSMGLVKSETSYNNSELSTPQTSVSKRAADTDLKTDSAKKACFGDEYQDDEEIVDDEITQKIKEFCLYLKTLASKKIHVQKLLDAASKCGLLLKDDTDEVPNGLQCKFFLNGVEISVGDGSRKKEAKSDAFEKAQIMPDSPHLQAVQPVSSGKKELHVSSEPFEGLEEKELPKSPVKSSVVVNPQLDKNALQNFVILQTRYAERRGQAMDATILHNSADFNEVPFYFKSCKKHENYMSQISIGDHFIVSVDGDNKRAVRHLAACEALKILRKICWTLRTKQATVCDGDKVERDEIFAAVSQKSAMDTAISDNNIGSIILKKMGWTGGGLGKEGNKGIAEPVKVQQVINRNGLGLDKSKRVKGKLKSCVRSTLHNYVVSGNQKDLVFSSTFTKRERVTIRKEARKFGLKIQCRGRRGRKFLVFCKKSLRASGKLVEHLMDIGGSSDKYELIPPESS